MNFKFNMPVITALAASASLALWTSPSEADLRDYLLNQGYSTAERGEFEVETFNDLHLHRANHSDTYASNHEVELEYGLTDHFQLAGYAVWAWEQGAPVAYDQWKAEVKYRLADAGTLPLDLAVYLEYANQNGSPPDDSDTVEGKVILSKDWRQWNATVNLVAEKQIQHASAAAFEWTAGLNYGWTPRLSTGLELQETLGTRHDFGLHRTEHELYLMPTIGWSPTPHSKILIGPAFGLTRATDDVQIRTMVAIEF